MPRGSPFHRRDDPGERSAILLALSLIFTLSSNRAIDGVEVIAELGQCTAGNRYRSRKAPEVLRVEVQSRRQSTVGPDKPAVALRRPARLHLATGHRQIQIALIYVRTQDPEA
jgi:hypothetical protein